MKISIAAFIYMVAIGLAAPAEAVSCKKISEPTRPCYWTKGIVTDSADAGDVISVEDDAGGYILDHEPDALSDIFKARHLYIVGDYLFCPFPQRVHQGSGELWNYGCVERFRNVTIIEWMDISPQAFANRVCHLVDCNRPGFKNFRDPYGAR